jgi:hypothetical protein
LIFSSIVIGKISSPTFESLVKTETSSRTFLSFPMSVYRKEVGRGERQKSNNVPRYAPAYISDHRQGVDHLLIRFLFYCGSCGGHLNSFVYAGRFHLRRCQRHPLRGDLHPELLPFGTWIWLISSTLALAL